MKITIAGSLGNIGRPLTQILTAQKHDVTVISSSTERKAEIEGLGAKAAIGSISDAEFLATAFAGADAVFTMTPPNMGGSNIIANTTKAGEAFAAAITQSGVKRVVMLSSIGADVPQGTGPITALYNIEQIFNGLNNIDITFLRAGYFYTNFYGNVPMIKHMDIIGSNLPENTPLVLVHPHDIATAAAKTLHSNFTGKNVEYIVSDVVTPAQVAKALGTAIGKPQLPWVEFTDEQALQGMVQAGLPEEIAGLYTEMGTGLRSGIIAAHFIETNAPINGTTKLEDFAHEFKAQF